MKAILWIVVLVLIVWGGWALMNKAPVGDVSVQSRVVPVVFANHLQAGFPEQDVFIESGTASSKSQVVRMEGNIATGSAVLNSLVYASATTTIHDPFKVGQNPLGSFPKGKSLGITLEQWLAGTGSGTYTVDSGAATLDLTFQNLVPNATYTLWCSRLTLPPN